VKKFALLIWPLRSISKYQIVSKEKRRLRLQAFDYCPFFPIGIYWGLPDIRDQGLLIRWVNFEFAAFGRPPILWKEKGL
jgi:hypothetical protein